MLILLTGIADGPAAGIAALLQETDSSLRVARIAEPSAPMVREQKPDVIVLGPQLRIEDALSLTDGLASSDAAVEVVIVTADANAKVLRAAMRLGVRDVLSSHDPLPEVVSAVLLALEAVRSRKVPVDVEPVERGEVHQAKVMTVFSTKGGVGKTVIATNLAVLLAKSGRVVLLDLDLESGDTAIMLQLIPNRSIYDAVQAIDRLDGPMLTGFLLEHESGVRLLAAPVHPEEAEIVTSATVGKIISLLRDLFDYVVIDTPAYLNDVVITALEQSDEIYAVTTMDLPSVKNVRIMLQKLRQLGTDMDRARLVLNRADSKVGLQMSDVASALEREIVAKVPSDRLVPLSVNRGNPVVLDAPRSAVAKSLIALSQLASQRDEGVHAGVA